MTADLPIPVTVTVSAKNDPNDLARELLTTKVMLRRENEELTVFRFKLDHDASLVPGGVSSLYRPLRSSSRKERS